MTFILILLGIIVLVGVVFAAAVWYAVIFTLMALGVLAAFIFFLLYAIFNSSSGDPGVGAAVGILVTLLVVGGLIYAYSKNKGSE